MEECDPLAGDNVKFYGKVKQPEREAVNAILGSIYFFSEKLQVERSQEMLQVKEPLKNSTVSTPFNH